MKFALLIHETKDQMAKRNGPQAPAYWAAWSAFSEAVAKAGVMTGGAGLEPPSRATTLRVHNGAHRVEDGPYADSKELFGGFFVVDVPDHAAAMEWARRIPVENGSVEVRPVMQM
jgi:hypothetical protein